jgi:pilus assembly protein CpaC
MSRVFTRALALCIALVNASVARAQDAETIALSIGEQRVLSGEGVASYSEGTPGVVDVRLTQDGASFVIVGKREGQTSLLLIMLDGRKVQHRIRVSGIPGATHGASGTAPPNAIEARDNIRLELYFVQLTREGGMQVGMEWPATYGGGSLQASVNLLEGSLEQASAAITDQALPRLDLAQSAGWAKVVRKAAVITANGTEASFSGGGEVNLPVQTSISVGVRQIVFGSSIRVLPRYDRDSGRIELAIHAEVSDLASDRGSGIPGRITSTLDSVVSLELGQSIALAGLTAQSEGASKTGLPWLSQIPILGALFGLHASREERSDNLIFIVPSVVDAVALDARAHVRSALAAARAYEGQLDGKLLAPPRRAQPLAVPAP